MENDEAYEVIRDALSSICLRDCEPEWDNCRHKEADYWLTLLLEQVRDANL